MKRRAFVRRMAFAALATVFLDLPLPEAAVPMREVTFSLDTDELRDLSRLIREVYVTEVFPAWRAMQARRFSVDLVELG